MPVTRAVAKGRAEEMSVEKGGGSGQEQERKRKDRSVVPWLDRDDHPLKNDVVLATLFGFYRGKDLKPSRLVSKKWNVASLPFVRNRFSVSISWQEMNEVQLINSNTLGIPFEFETYRLGAFDTRTGSGQQLIQLCGKTAKSIVFLDPDVHMIEDIAQVLRSTPKLEYLYLPKVMTSKDRKQKVIKLFPEGMKPNLPFLKSVKMEGRTNRQNPIGIMKKCPTFFEELFEVAENMSTLDLTSFSSELGLKILGTISKFGRMESIKNLRVHLTAEKALSAEHLELLKGLKLEHLDLSLWRGVIVDWFELIAPSRNTLTSLAVGISVPDLTTLTFQPIPKLKKLKLEINADNCLGPNCINFSQIFPSLKLLNLHISLMFPTGNELNFLLGDSNPCPNMKSLITRQHSMNMETFHRVLTIFPSLKAFKCEIKKIIGVEIIMGIWTHMTQLEELAIHGVLESSVNLDSLVTGLPVQETRRMGMKKFLDSLQKQNVEIRTEQILLEANKHRQLPSIKNLTGLISLELKLTTKKPRGREANYLTDVTAFFAVYSLKNLRHLAVHDCEITKNWMNVLIKDLGLHTWYFTSSPKIKGRIHYFKYESK